jgi:hypothetical protein
MHAACIRLYTPIPVPVPRIEKEKKLNESNRAGGMEWNGMSLLLFIYDPPLLRVRCFES